MSPDDLPDDPAKAIEHLHQLRAARLGFGRYAECPNGPTAPLLRESVAKARLAADQERPRFQHRIGYRHATDEAPLTPRAIRKLLDRLNRRGISLRALSRPQYVVIERRGSDIPGSDIAVIEASVRSIAEHLLAKRTTEDRRR